MMKKYVLPSLVSLALSSSWTLAEQSQTQETPEVSPSAIMQPSDEAIKQHQEQMEKQRAQMQEQMEKQKAEWMAHKQEMQALRDKLQQTTDPEERQRLMEEQQQQRQKMHEKMWKQRGMMPPKPSKPYYGPGGGYGPGWGGPGAYYGPQRGYYRPYDRRGRMPNIPRPNYHKPYNRDGGMPGKFGKEKRGGYHTQVEQRLENIEKLLQQLVDLSKEK